ncbi:MAG: hypothetical protein GF317_21860 [Candidatus Lokiarchaeota archaeon]|nr:hypothetical protein [Candidatus Lokiarchaeota archaeon]MBD3202107.1 hypothetical protein [Candidatus Lokiarchaeota archaeon]
MEDKKGEFSEQNIDLTLWLKSEKNKIQRDDEQIQINKESDLEKPKLSFGYGYNPENLKEGLKDYKLSHELKQGIKLYTFSPKLSYRIFNELAKIIQFKFIGSELRKGNTIIKNKYFITAKDPKEIYDLINNGIRELFNKFEPIPKYDI